MPEPTETWQIDQWKAWLAERPPLIREVAERLPPWRDYVLTPTGQGCRIHSYDDLDEGRVVMLTVVTVMDGEPVTVFGVKPGDLESQT